ncbi:MAG: ADP-ribosylglycohydrolase family protein [Muribaculaceae bacterium]|nr:ADP-ribosylglycohydrolase family protein [Muribaculaceae bacterium]
MNDIYRQRLLGGFMGYAIGNALGLGTEFMTSDEAAIRYPQGLTDYSQIIRDAHRSQWQRGDITNDTRILLHIVEEIIRQGRLDQQAIARRLVEWYDDDHTTDHIPCIRWCLSDSEYTSDPVGTTRKVWSQMGHFDSTNEAIGRGILGATMHNNPRETTAALIRLTHYGTRCMCTAHMVGHMAYDLLWHGHVTPIEALTSLARNFDETIVPYLYRAYEGTLADLQLDDEDLCNDAAHTMMAALWPLWHCNSAEETLHTIVMAAGDADTNASAAMALAGIRYGYDALPKHLIEGLIERERIENLAHRWSDFVLADLDSH